MNIIQSNFKSNIYKIISKCEDSFHFTSNRVFIRNVNDEVLMSLTAQFQGLEVAYNTTSNTIYMDYTNRLTNEELSASKKYNNIDDFLNDDISELVLKIR